MKRTFFLLTLLLGIACWSVAPVMAKDDDKKMSRAEKKELKKKEKEAKKKSKAGEDKKDKDDDKDIDKKALSKIMKSVATFYGKVKANGKFYLFASYNTLTDPGIELLRSIQENDADFKRGKISVLLINAEDNEDKEAIKGLKKLKIKQAAVHKGKWENFIKQDTEGEEDTRGLDPSFSYPSGVAWTLCSASGKKLGAGNDTDIERCFELAGIKTTEKKQEKEDDAAEEE